MGLEQWSKLVPTASQFQRERLTSLTMWNERRTFRVFFIIDCPCGSVVLSASDWTKTIEPFSFYGPSILGCQGDSFTTHNQSPPVKLVQVKLIWDLNIQSPSLLRYFVHTGSLSVSFSFPLCEHMRQKWRNFQVLLVVHPSPLCSVADLHTLKS